MIRSPSEFFLRYLISRNELVTTEEELKEQIDEISRIMNSMNLESIGLGYIQNLIADMTQTRPGDYFPDNPHHKKSKEYLKYHRIFDMWYPTKEVRESNLILSDLFLREKIEPLMLSTITPSSIIRKVRKYTSISLTVGGIGAYGHYYWNRNLMSKGEWLDFLRYRTGKNPYIQSLVISPDVAPQHLPWIVGVSGPKKVFNTAEAASRIGQIAFKHALELENQPASFKTTSALRNCMSTLKDADEIMRRSDAMLQDVLNQFQKFRMRLDDAEVIDVNRLTDGKHSQSSGSESDDDESF